MKESGAKGEEIIERLAENNSNFDKRTEFSKKKYLKRKKQKYLSLFELKDPTVFDLCDMYNVCAPYKIGNLRFDSLSLLLNLSNIHARSKCMVIDGTAGLLTVAACERVAPNEGGQVYMFALEEKPFPNLNEHQQLFYEINNLSEHRRTMINYGNLVNRPKLGMVEQALLSALEEQMDCAMVAHESYEAGDTF